MSQTPIWARFFQLAGAVAFVSIMLIYASIAADFGYREVFLWTAVVAAPTVGLLMSAGAILLMTDRLNRRDAKRGGKAASGDR